MEKYTFHDQVVNLKKFIDDTEMTSPERKLMINGMVTSLEVRYELDVPPVQPKTEERPAESAQNVSESDLISRKAAIDAIIRALIRATTPINNGDGTCTITPLTNVVIRKVLNELPSAQPDIARDIATIIENEKDMRVISQNAGQWIPVSEALPKDDEEVIVTCLDDSGDTPFRYTTVAWHYKGMWVCENERCPFVVAWMPLPEPWRGGQDGTT